MTTCLVGVLLALVVIGAVLAAWRKGGAEPADAAPMPVWRRRVLMAYLLLAGSLLTYAIAALISIEFPATALMPSEQTLKAVPEQPLAKAGQPTAAKGGAPAAASSGSGGQHPGQASGAKAAAPGATAGQGTSASDGGNSAAAAGENETTPRGGEYHADSGPRLIEIFPQTTLGTVPSVSLAVYGQNFTKESRLRFNMNERETRFVQVDLLKATLRAADLANKGEVLVDVINPGDRISNAIAVPIQRPVVPLALFGWKICIAREMQLILLAIFAGALGSYIHAIKSFADFVGNRTLTASWFWWYIARPFLGMAMALVFYAVVRGGFIAGSPADSNVVNPFGVIAVGALVGMFADRAAQKLSEIFDTLFRTDVPRGDKLNAPIIDSLDPNKVTVGTKPLPVLKIVGDRLGKVTIVRLNAEERKPDKVSEKELSVQLLEKDLARPGEIAVTAVNPDGGLSPAATFHVVAAQELAITSPQADSLPDGTVGSDYSQVFAAAGGTSSHHWSAAGLPPELGMNDSGTLAGKPSTPNTFTVAVTVTDGAGKESSRRFGLKVKAAPAP
jgi:hypothetical protein